MPRIKSVSLYTWISIVKWIKPVLNMERDLQKCVYCNLNLYMPRPSLCVSEMQNNVSKILDDRRVL